MSVPPNPDKQSSPERRMARREDNAPAMQPRAGGALRLLRDVTNYGLPVGLLLFLVLGAPHMTVLFALPLALAAFLGLYFILNPLEQPAPDPTHEDVRLLLEHCAASVARIETQARAMSSGPNHEQVVRIADHGGRIVRNALTAESPTLSDANRLDLLLAQIAQIIGLYARIGANRASRQPGQPDILHLSEEALLGWEDKGIGADVDQFEVAVEMLKHIMRMEGLARSPDDQIAGRGQSTPQGTDHDHQPDSGTG